MAVERGSHVGSKSGRKTRGRDTGRPKELSKPHVPLMESCRTQSGKSMENYRCVCVWLCAKVLKSRTGAGASSEPARRPVGTAISDGTGTNQRLQVKLYKPASVGTPFAYKMPWRRPPNHINETIGVPHLQHRSGFRFFYSHHRRTSVINHHGRRAGGRAKGTKQSFCEFCQFVTLGQSRSSNFFGRFLREKMCQSGRMVLLCPLLARNNDRLDWQSIWHPRPHAYHRSTPQFCAVLRAGEHIQPRYMAHDDGFHPACLIAPM